MYRQSLIVSNYYLSNCINNTSVVVRCALCVVRCVASPQDASSWFVNTVSPA